MYDNIIKPKSIQRNSKCGLIAPSGKIDENQFDKVLEKIEILGLKPVYTNRIFKKDGYLAGNDTNRLDDLHEMFDNKEIESIICIRGGFGATRLLQSIDYKLIAANPKIFIGYSDITALQYAFLVKAKLVTFHGVVGVSAFTDYTSKSFKNLFFDKIMNVNYFSDDFFREPDNAEFRYYNINEGVATGNIIGGNLSMMVSMTGTNFDVDYNGKIVMIEDIDEYPYKIDRMLTHLIQATNIKNASAIVLGIFKDCSIESKKLTENDSLSLQRIFQDKFSGFQMPVIYGFPFGHIKSQTIFPIGIKSQLNTYINTLTYIENVFSDVI